MVHMSIPNHPKNRVSRTTRIRGFLWAGLFVAAVLAVVSGVLVYQAAGWTARLEAVRGAPEEAAAILSDKAFQSAYRRQSRRGESANLEAPTESVVRSVIDGVARSRCPSSYKQSGLNMSSMDSRTGAAAGKVEIRASFALEGIDTRTLQDLILEIEEKRPGLVCKELHLKPSASSHRFDVVKIVFSILVSNG